MLIKVLKQLILILLILAVEVSLTSNLPFLANRVNVVLIAIVFISIVYNFYLGVVYGLILGLCLDLYSALPFGVMLGALMFSLLIVYLIATHLLTNKSFYSLLGLTFISTISFNFIIFVYSLLRIFLSIKDVEMIEQLAFLDLKNLFWRLFFNLALMIVFFTFFHLASRRFKAVFIDTTKG